MSFVSPSTFEILAFFATLAAVVVVYYKWSYQYWKRKGLPYLEPTMPYGNLEGPFGRINHSGIVFKNLYDELKSKGHKHGGVYGFSLPRYMPIDPEYVKNILSRDFQHFVDRGVYFNEKNDPISAHLFSIEGTKWRKLRSKLTPTFSSGKMKNMFQTLLQCGDQLIEAMKNFESKAEPIDIKDVLGCFTTDVIGSSAFGLDCNSFKNPDSDFRKYGKLVFQSDPVRLAKFILVGIFPKLSKFLGVGLTPTKVSRFFTDVVKKTVAYRENNNYVRKDFLQLLINLRNGSDNEGMAEKNHGGDGFTMDDIVAQAYVFFLAGFETSSTTMTFCLYELAVNPHIQEKVRDEVNNVLAQHNGQMTYDAITEMKYMQQVIDESLRKYPPGAMLLRKCTNTYKIRNENVTIEKDTLVIIPVLALHHDPEFYPEPDKFDPERFSDENRGKRHPYTFIPFGEGPRICIGIRFGIMQAKVGLALLLRNFKFSLNEKTQSPLKMDPFNIVLSPVGGVWLNVEKL